MEAPNALWRIEFKRQFILGGGGTRQPLTVVDGSSSHLLACQGLPPPAGVRARWVLERLFQTYGPPDPIRSDNGAPIATEALDRLSALSVWWL